MNDADAKRYLLVDGHGLAFRGFYALPEMNAPDGTPTNAVLGFMNMLLKAQDEWQPEETIIFFDPHGPTARDSIFAGYKDGRAPAPDAFKQQMPIIIKMSEMLGHPVIIVDGHEADDCIASAAREIDEAGGEAVILSADKDLLQVLRGRMKMARPTKGVSEMRVYDCESFTAEYGFPPSSMADYLALVGDTADNIPGVPGIGDKTARSLLGKYGTMAGIYDHLAELPKGQAAKFEQGRELARLSYELAVPQPVPPIGVDGLSSSEMDRDAMRALCAALGLKKLAERLGIDEAHASPAVSIAAQVVDEAEARDVFGSNVISAVSAGDAFVIASRSAWARASAEEVASWLARDDSELVLHESKDVFTRHAAFEGHMEKIFDVETAHYFYHPDAKTHALSSIAQLDAGAPPQAVATASLALWTCFLESEHADAMREVMRSIDMPLVPVLNRLEADGLSVSADDLASLASELTSHISQTERSIYEAAGCIINLNSPKQVGDLLFHKLGLPVIKKTKTGTSTNAEVLEELARLPDPFCRVPSLMLDHRECTKMLSGFVEPFTKYARGSRDGRIRSTFSHTSTGTGRLASSDPNVQNIPAFGTWAEKLRAAFRPCSDDAVLVSADYSQIELRVLAHLSGEERLIEAFASERDIHRETASWIFGAEPEAVSQEQRRFAKTVNFGLIYGMSAHGLAARMGISRTEAAQMIDKYFTALPRVKSYLSDSAREAKSRGYTRSIFGRIRPLDEAIEGSRGGASDRIAVNTPIQSAASDIAKIALIKFDKALRGSLPSSKIVLQVHDSIVCETQKSDAAAAADLLTETMESLRYIDVPLKAEANVSVAL